MTETTESAQILNRQLKAALRPLHHQAVRDLAWCCLAQPLMASSIGNHYQLFSPSTPNLYDWLRQLDADPAALLTQIASIKSTRLGLYYEQLWHFYFASQPDWELLAHNQQINCEGITLGSFDFLCKHQNRYWHIETAVKFYLCAASDSMSAHEWNNWIGPEKRDRLDIKLTHLHSHQLRLTRHKDAQQWLQQHLPRAQHWQSALCLQGYFFRRAKNHKPVQSNPNLPYENWMTCSEFYQYLSQSLPAHWAVIDHHYWLSPLQLNGDSATELACLEDHKKIYDKLSQRAAHQTRPLLIAKMKYWEQENYWQEYERFFITADDWLEQSPSN